jgi:hypothetical protein
METQFTLRDEGLSMSIRRANWLGVSLLGIIVLIAGATGCTMQSHIGEEVKKQRPQIPPKPGDKPYQIAIRNYLTQNLVEPEFDDVKWYAPVEQRDGEGGVGLAVRFKFREKRPGTTIKEERDRLFLYTSKGEVRAMGSTKR